MRNPPATTPAANGTEPVVATPTPVASTVVRRWPPGLMSEVASTKCAPHVNGAGPLRAVMEGPEGTVLGSQAARCRVHQGRGREVVAVEATQDPVHVLACLRIGRDSPMTAHR